MIGGHYIEKTMNRQVAADCKAIVVSVSYRMAPEFRYPYAVNDSFDVLKWVSTLCDTTCSRSRISDSL